jgi:elongation factor Tu
MAKELNIAVIGHVDHGKSSLLAAMSSSFSKVGLASYVPYEQIDLAALNNSVSGLNLNRAELKIAGKTRSYRLIDFPSHQDYIKSLITADSIDGILLVVSAADGTMPQTREHLHLAKEIGVEKLIFVLNKADMVSSSLQDMVECEVRDLLEEEGFFTKSCPAIKGSALLARNCACGDRNCPKCGFLFSILDTLDKCVKEPQPESGMSLLFAVEEAFETPFGPTLIKGCLKRGTLKKGDKIKILLDKDAAELTLKAMELDGVPADDLSALSSASLYVEGVKAGQVLNGSVIVPLKGIDLIKQFKAIVYIFRKEEDGRETPFGGGHKSQFSFWGKKLEGSFKFPPDREMVMPGDSSVVWISLQTPSFVEKGFTFSIVENERNIGIGKVVEVME